MLTVEAEPRVDSPTSAPFFLIKGQTGNLKTSWQHDDGQTTNCQRLPSLSLWVCMLPAPLFFLEASADRIAQDLALLALLLIPAIPSGNPKVHVVNKDKTTIDCTPNLHYFFSWWEIRQILAPSPSCLTFGSKPSRGNKIPGQPQSLHPQKPYLGGFKGHFESHFLHVWPRI